MTNNSQDLMSDSTPEYPEADFDLDFVPGYPFGQSVLQHQPYLIQQYPIAAQTGLGFAHSTDTSFSTSRTGSNGTLISAVASPAPQYVKPGSYIPMIDHVVTRDNFDNGDSMYSDQHVSASGFLSPSFYSDFGEPFP
jgi:hypothetical protein